MVAFQASGAGAKYRLGNEADTYGELTFVNYWINAKRDTDKAWMKTNVTVQADTTESSTYASNDKFRLREAFVQMGNVLQRQPETKFWAGERYYRRLNIDINDFYMLDTSGYGGGFEDLNLKFAQSSVSYLAGAGEDIQTDSGTYPKSLANARLYGIKAPYGKLGVVRLFLLQRRHDARQYADSICWRLGRRNWSYKNRTLGRLQPLNLPVRSWSTSQLQHID